MMRCLGIVCLMLLPLPQLAQAADPPSTPALQGSAPQVGVNPCGGAGSVVLRPIVATHTQPPYPADSQRLGEQGLTTMRVEIGPDGAVASDSLVTSSGSPRLDQAALDFVKDHYRWEPVDCTRPVATALRIVWALRNPSPLDAALASQVIHFIAADPANYPPASARVSRMTSTVVVLKDDGTIGQVVVLRTSGDSAIDERSVAAIRTHRWAPAQMDGKAMGGFVVASVIWTPPGQQQPNLDDVSRVMQLFAPPAPSPPP
jgi:TonB family protein